MNIIKLNEMSPETLQSLFNRPLSEDSTLDDKVKEICLNIKNNGAVALRKYSLKFDSVDLDDFRVSANEIEEASKQVNKSLKEAIGDALKNIQKFHSAQFPTPEIIETSPSIFCHRELRSIENVGLYVPGGTAPLISTLLMLGVPAKLAECERIVICTPPDSFGDINPAILYAADLLGIDEIYKIGGAQAIAAMAYGTETIPSVDKIFGPGNPYVTAAKKFVSTDSGAASIDFPAGPTELLIIADKNADPKLIAWDLAAQAEHGENSNVLLVTDSQKIADNVSEAISNLSLDDTRKEIILGCLEKSYAIITDNIDEAVTFSNNYAPEHLSLHIENPDSVSDDIKNAGTVFLGEFTPPAAGDYATGANHTLPTNGCAKSFSGLSVNDFQKFITFQKIEEDGLEAVADTVTTLAEAETLYAHSESIKARLNDV